ncbi:MAG: lysylphosphatidylglycerol synthase transmembrane domain-containing protein [Myxococcota bacterium]|nr:lysylphosphatidylglycerol synthase transmembrane domain-containing protein [Myxococcota bacterium]
MEPIEPNHEAVQPAPRNRGRIALAQLAGSVVIVGLLLHDAEPRRVAHNLADAHLGWLGIAILIKSLSLTLHEIRLWVAVCATHPRPLMPILSIGYTSGLANSFLPIRGGDIVAVGLLKAEQNLPVSASVAAVGLTAFLEALAFAVFLLVVLATGATQWTSITESEGVFSIGEAMGGLTLGCLLAIAAAVALAILARRLRQPEGEPPRAGPVELIRQTLFHTGSSLSSWGKTALNLGLAIVQMMLLVGCFWALLPAANIELEPNLPLLATSGVIAFSAATSIVLPPAYGAGPTASAIAVLGLFGVAPDTAIAFSALTWLANNSPVLALGLYPMLRRIGRLGALFEAGQASSP